MGGLISRYQTTDIDEDKIMSFDSDGSLQMNQFQTGDLVFFSERFPSSSISRAYFRFQDRLWTNCGVVFHEPALWPDQVLLLETASVHPDDYLTDKLTLKNTGKGVRLVSLSDRIYSMKFEAIGIRRRRPREMLQPSADQQFQEARHIVPLAQENKDVAQQQFAIQVLKKLDIVKIPYVEPSLNSMAGSALDKLASYYKMEVKAFHKLKDNTTASPAMRLVKS